MARGSGVFKAIHELAMKDPFAKDFGLKDQISRSAGSVMDNIAEGFERGGTKEFIQFLAYARGSAGEVGSQLYRILDRNYIDEVQFESLKSQIIAIIKMITGFMMYLKKSELRGMKFHEPVTDYQISDSPETPETLNFKPGTRTAK